MHNDASALFESLPAVTHFTSIKLLLALAALIHANDFERARRESAEAGVVFVLHQLLDHAHLLLRELVVRALIVAVFLSVIMILVAL